MIILWIGVCVAAIVLELVTPTALVSIWFAVGGVIAALIAVINLPLWTQIVCFVVVSFVSMLVVRPIAARYLRGNTIATNADRFIGEIGVVTQAITNEAWGEVKVGNATWHAIAAEGGEIAMDTHVKVVAIEGAKLLVRQVD